MSTRTDDADALERAKDIAKRTLSGEIDTLLACRDMTALRLRLPNVPQSVMDTFIAVASEVDDLALGSDRGPWSLEALKASDAAAADYRERVETVVLAAMEELVVALENEYTK